MERTSRFRVSPHVRTNVIPEGVTFLDITSGQLLVANGIGGRIWQRLESGSSEDDIVAELTREFGGVPAVADDVRRFIASLEQRAFLQRESKA